MQKITDIYNRRGEKPADGMTMRDAFNTSRRFGSAPPTKAVLKIERPSPQGCPDCSPHLGTLWLCKKHTPIVSIAHMGFWRFVWCRVVLFSRADIIIRTKAVTVKVLEFVLIAIIITQILFLAGRALLNSIDANAVIKCNQLKEQSQAGFAGKFFISEKEKNLCDSYQIEIDAPVGSPYEN